MCVALSHGGQAPSPKCSFTRPVHLLPEGAKGKGSRSRALPFTEGPGEEGTLVTLMRLGRCSDGCKSVRGPGVGTRTEGHGEMELCHGAGAGLSGTEPPSPSGAGQGPSRPTSPCWDTH